MIYLASPYSDPDPAVKAWRWREVCKKAAEMMKAGERVFSPIAHTHPIGEFGLPGGWAYWAAYDREMIKFCSEVVVLQLDGWENSVGVTAEIALAKELGRPVRFVTKAP